MVLQNDTENEEKVLREIETTTIRKNHKIRKESLENLILTEYIEAIGWNGKSQQATKLAQDDKS